MSEILGQNHNQDPSLSRKRNIQDKVSNQDDSDPESKIMHSSDEEDQLMTIGAIMDPHK